MSRNGASCRPWEVCAPPQGHAATRVWDCVYTLGKNALFSDNGTHTSTVVAAALVAPVRVARTEDKVVGGVVLARRILRGRPIVAIIADTVEAGVEAVARCRQEDAITIVFTDELPTFHAI